MKKLSLFFALLYCLMPSITQAATLDKMAAAIVRQLDRQIVERLGQEESPAKGVSLFVTTPVDINNLSESNALARQMQEDITQAFVEMGYTVQEIRKAARLTFDQETGEMVLTRDIKDLSSIQAAAVALVAGTYSLTGQNIRFNIKLITTSSLETLAMASITVPLTSDLASLLKRNNGFSLPIEPTVITRLP